MPPIDAGKALVTGSVPDSLSDTQCGIVCGTGLEAINPGDLPSNMAKKPFRYFKTSPEIIQLGVLIYVRFPLSLRNVEDLLHERGIDICHESIRL